MQEGIDLAKVPMTTWFHKQLRSRGTHSMGSSSVGGEVRLMVHSSMQQHYRDTGVGSRGQGSGRRAWLPLGVASSRIPGASAQLRAVSISSSNKGSSSSGGGGGGGSNGQVQHGVSMLTGRFRDWVCQEEKAGKITFSIKGVGDVCVTEAVAV